MMKFLIRIAFALIALNIIGGVMISHKDEDIRAKILSSFKNTPKKQQFKIFHFLFEKKYELNSEEGFNRYRIFKNNLKFIESQNSKQTSYTLGITNFSDLTAGEFRKTYLSSFSLEKNPFSLNKFLIKDSLEKPSSNLFSGNEDSDEILIKQKLLKNSNPLTQVKIDWFRFLTPPKDQAYCGACWAFATIGAIEGNYNMKFGNSPNFSQQQLVDCDTNEAGCDGGWPTNALYYIQQNGIAFDNEYPYTSGKLSNAETCTASTKTMNKVVDTYFECPYQNCSKTQHRNLLNQGPIVVAIDGDGNSEGSSIFQHYTGGILDMPCSYVNHAVLLVGVDSDSSGEFYTGRNSWGSSWGENGNFRFRARNSDNTCYMENYAVLPQVKQTFNPVPPPVTQHALNSMINVIEKEILLKYVIILLNFLTSRWRVMI